ncbi:MAG: protein-export chaperone SecB [Bacteroidota bacterium]|nr:protein-export chaperone SecB [Bacteroidota bacterium]
MKGTNEAIFSFEKFKIAKFSFTESENQEHQLSIKIEPSGTYDEVNSRFELTFVFKAFDKNDKETPMIDVSLVAYFKFKETTKIHEIPDYFYRNSLAIVFPYLRSFISSLTLQANIKLLVLPIFNLSNLEKPLRENTLTTA